MVGFFSRVRSLMAFLTVASLNSCPSLSWMFTMLPPRKSMPSEDSRLVPMTTSAPMKRTAESIKAGFRISINLIVFAGIRFMKLSFLRAPVLLPQKKKTRVTRRAANIEERIPIVRVIANPFIWSEARQRRMIAVRRVVMLASKIALKAFSYAARIALTRDFPPAISSRNRS